MAAPFERTPSGTTFGLQLSPELTNPAEPSMLDGDPARAVDRVHEALDPDAEAWLMEQFEQGERCLPSAWVHARAAYIDPEQSPVGGGSAAERVRAKLAALDILAVPNLRPGHLSEATVSALANMTAYDRGLQRRQSVVHLPANPLDEPYLPEPPREIVLDADRPAFGDHPDSREEYPQ